MKWIDALRKWNNDHNKGKWCIPKKGSQEYDIVRKIMNQPKVIKGNVLNYVRAMRDKTTKENPELSAKEINHMLLRQWKTLSEKEQLKYA